MTTYTQALSDAVDALQAALEACPNERAYAVDCAKLQSYIDSVSAIQLSEEASDRRDAQEKGIR